MWGKQQYINGATSRKNIFGDNWVQYFHFMKIKNLTVFFFHFLRGVVSF